MEKAMKKKTVSQAQPLQREDLAGSVLSAGESVEAFEEVMREHRARFGGADEVEQAIVEDLTALWWRTRRAQEVETEWLEQEVGQEGDEDERVRIARAMGRLVD